MVINTGKELREAIEGRVKEEIVQEIGVYKHLGMVIRQSWNGKAGNSKDHMLQLKIKNMK